MTAKTAKDPLARLRTSDEAVERLFELLPSGVASAARALEEAVRNAEGGVLRARTAAEGVPKLDELIRKNPRCTALILLRGFFKRTANSFEEAVQDLTEGLRFHAGEPHGWFWRATAYGGMARFAEAIPDLDRALTIAPGIAEYYKMRGQAKEKVGLLEEAIEDFGKSLKLDPAYHWAFIGRSMCLTRLGRMDEALADLDSAVKLCDSEEWSYLKRSLLRRQVGDVLGAVEDVNRACEINPSCDWIQGKPPFQVEKLKEAISQLDGLLGRSPDTAWAYAWRGQTKSKLGDCAGAEADLSKALLKGDLGRGRGWVLSWRGEARAKQGKFPAAEIDFSEAIAARPEYPRAYFWRAEMWLARGEGARALADLEKAIALDDRMPEVHLLLGKALESQGRLDESLAALTRGLRTDPSGGDFLKSRARVRSALGDPSGQAEDLLAYYGKIQVSAEGWRPIWEELIREAGGAVAAKVWALLPIPDEVLVAQAAEARARGDPGRSLELLDQALRTRGGAIKPAVHQERGLALKSAGRLGEALSSFKDALRLGALEQSPAPVSGPETPAGVDPRLEFLGGLQRLVEPAPIPGFCRRLLPGVADYLEEGTALMASFRGDPAVESARAALQEPRAYRWFPMAKLMLSVSEPPDFEPLTVQAEEFRHQPFLEALRELARRSRFMDFFAAHRSDFRKWSSAMEGAVGREDFTGEVGRYLGVELKADYAVRLGLLLRSASYSDEITLKDGWTRARTVVCPMDDEEYFRQFLISPDPEALWAKGWHELAHVAMDAWIEPHEEAVARAGELYEKISGSARRGGWQECFSEHLVVAPSCRLLFLRRGARASSRQKDRYKRAGYIFMDPVLKGLEAYEGDRGRYPCLSDFYPEWIKVLAKLQS